MTMLSSTIAYKCTLRSSIVHLVYHVVCFFGGGLPSPDLFPHCLGMVKRSNGHLTAKIIFKKLKNEFGRGDYRPRPMAKIIFKKQRYK